MMENLSKWLMNDSSIQNFQITAIFKHLQYNANACFLNNIGNLVLSVNFRILLYSSSLMIKTIYDILIL